MYLQPTFHCDLYIRHRTLCCEFSSTVPFDANKFSDQPGFKPEYLYRSGRAVCYKLLGTGTAERKATTLASNAHYNLATYVSLPCKNEYAMFLPPSPLER